MWLNGVSPECREEKHEECSWKEDSGDPAYCLCPCHPTLHKGADGQKYGQLCLAVAQLILYPILHRSHCDRAGMIAEPPMKKCTCGLQAVVEALTKVLTED